MDVVAEIIRLCSATGRDHWESALCRELGGRHWYIAATTGRAQVRELVRLGVAARSARAKVYGR